MRCVIQRVKQAKVLINQKIISQINQGLLVLVAIHSHDTKALLTKTAEKIINLRIFSDESDKMNQSVLDIKGEILLVSQFTLYGDCTKGNRPSFIQAAEPSKAKQYYEELIKILENSKLLIKTGQFQAHMEVELINDGPVTIIIEN